MHRGKAARRRGEAGPDRAAAPAHKDSPARLKPQGVTLTPSCGSRPRSTPGESVTYKVTAKLEPGLHIYAYAKSDAIADGPIPTTFDFFDTAGLAIEGDWKPDREPIPGPSRPSTTRSSSSSRTRSPGASR